MKTAFTKIPFLERIDPEDLISEVRDFYKTYYTRENLEKHIAYLSDIKPGRRSSAYALAPTSDLPHVRTDHLFLNFPGLHYLTMKIRPYLGVSSKARLLFNIQEYYSESSEVPKHNDGELLQFSVDDSGKLIIQESLRPARVGVLTLVNDVAEGAGTRLWNKDKSSVVKCGVGDLLVFDNLNYLHSVDKFNGKAIRKDGLLRLIIGWRSLDETCVHEVKGKKHSISTQQARIITKDWLFNSWPTKWKEIEQNLGKAAF